MDLPPHDLAAVDVQDQVEAEEEPFDRSGQISDIPAPDLVGSGGLQRLRPRMGGSLGPSPMGQLVVGTQHPVEGRFRAR